jgi:hypothetical protein
MKVVTKVVAVLVVLVVIAGVTLSRGTRGNGGTRGTIDTSMDTERVRGAITGEETGPILDALRKYDVMLVRHEREVSQLREIEGLRKMTSPEMKDLLDTHRVERDALRTEFEYDLYIYINSGTGSKGGLSWQHLSAYAKNKIIQEKAQT